MSSTSPPVTGDRKLFSDVTRLGFAAAHDSPSLNAEESIDSLSTLETTGEASRLTGTIYHCHYSVSLFFGKLHQYSSELLGLPAYYSFNLLSLFRPLI